MNGIKYLQESRFKKYEEEGVCFKIFSFDYVFYCS